jgi:hypothetical protein
MRSASSGPPTSSGTPSCRTTSPATAEPQPDGCRHRSRTATIHARRAPVR